MADQRKGGIAWTQWTWSPTRGCSRISTGCEGCYAERIAERFSGPGQPFEGYAIRGKGWTGKVVLLPDKLTEPLSWRKPRTVFVDSTSDLFHERLSDEEIAAVFGVMAACPQHTFQILTKRAERMRRWFRAATLIDCTMAALHAEARTVGDGGPLHTRFCADPDGPWPLSNVHLAVSVEDQAGADARIPHLLACPAAVRWISYEPAIGPADFTWWLRPTFGPTCARGPSNLSWLVIGGESGPQARPFDLSWARDTIRQCREAGTGCFVKQLGAHPRSDSDDDRRMCGDMNLPHPFRLHLTARAGGDPSEWPEDLRVRQYPEATR